MQFRRTRHVRPLRGVALGLAASALLASVGSTSAQPAAPPAYDVLPVGPGGAPVFVGTAEPGVVLELLDGALVVATGVANERGEWILMAPGRAGAAGTFTVRVAPALASIGTPPPASIPAPTPAWLTAGIGGDHAEGTADPSATITVTGAGAATLTAVADGEGRWTIPLPPLPVGAYSLRVATAEGAAETVVVLDLVLPLDPSGLRVAVTIAAPAFAAAEGTLAGPRLVVVGPRDTLWDIAVRAYGDGLRYGEIFAANRDQLRDPRRIFAGQVLLIP